MKVVPFAQTTLTSMAFDVMDEVGYEDDWKASESDELAEFAGRSCYLSYDRPNPATATNEAYLKNILDQGHESVFEHASVTFYVSGVSRNLLLELERHRHISFSVLSTRYVDAQKMGMSIHPNTPEYVIPAVRELSDRAQLIARETFLLMRDMGYPAKKAREVARQVLPGNTETRFLVTGNIRAWRDIIQKRYSEFADEEIRMFAGAILTHLKEIAPNSVQDLEI